MTFATERHGDLGRALIASGSGVLTRRCRARRVRGASVSDLQAVMLACGSARRSFLATQAPIGLGIVPGGDERSALLSSSSPITRRGPEAEIVSNGRPQAVRTAHRIARASKLGAELDNARRRTCASASSATKTVGLGVAKPGREIRKSSRRWEVCQHLSTDNKEARLVRVLNGPSARLATATVRSPRGGGGVNIGRVILRGGCRESIQEVHVRTVSEVVPRILLAPGQDHDRSASGLRSRKEADY